MITRTMDSRETSKASRTHRPARLMPTSPTLKPGGYSAGTAAAPGCVLAPPRCTAPCPPPPAAPPRAHLECLALELINDPADLPQQEGPGVDEVDPVHHDGNDTVPALEAPRQAVFDEERVAEHEPMLLVPKEDGAFTARAHLEQKHRHSRTQSQKTTAPAQILPSARISHHCSGSVGGVGMRGKLLSPAAGIKLPKDNVCYPGMQGPVKQVLNFLPP